MSHHAIEPVIIIVDDDQDDIALMVEALHALKHPGVIRFFVEPHKFLDYYRKCIDEHIPNVVVLDWNMPLLSGLDILKTLREEFPCNFSQILVFSTSIRQRDADEAKKTGAVEYYVKPTSFEEILLFAQQVLSHLSKATQEWKTSGSKI